MAKIAVTGVGGPAGRNVAALLLQRGHAVVGADMRDVSLPGVSFHRVPAASDVSFLSELSCLAAREKIDLLIPTVT